MLRELKKTLIDFFGNIKIYPGGIVLFGDTDPKLTGSNKRSVLNAILPGDVILLRHDAPVSGLFIKGQFKHAALYVGDGQVIHVVGDGIKKVELLDLLQADAVALVRPDDKTTISLAIARAFEQLAKGVKYDYDFDMNSSVEFYCSEFTDFCYSYILRKFAEDYIYPSLYLKSGLGFSTVLLIDYKN